jgi:sugar lactone lactonase YvrE
MCVPRFVLLGFLAHAGLCASTFGDKLWWSDWGTGKIERANLDGSYREEVFTELFSSGAIWFATDADAGYIYMAESWAARISRATMNGASIETLVTAGLQYPLGIVLDVSDGKMYWADRDTGKIQRADLDGTDVEDVLTDLARPKELAIDVAGAKLYWAEESTAPRLCRCNLDGTDIQELATIGLSHPGGLVLDHQDGKVYWLDFTFGTIYRADFDGSHIELFLDSLDYPAGLALDERRRVLHWSSQHTDRIRRIGLDDLVIEDVVFEGLACPFALAIAGGAYDVYDFRAFQACFGNEPLCNDCRGYDFDDDGDVDSADFSAYMSLFTGP